MNHDIQTKQVTVLLTGLSGATGTVVSANGEFVLVSQFMCKIIQKFWLKDPNCSTTKSSENSQGDPKNMETRRLHLETFWVSLFQ